ncbi:MAG: bifunctional DNA primase/polymerase [Pseudonocardiaceae bacterium]|nr:MAG: bifunctional DNA primase/polymerase [Pseudonocardiaceae bacterium]
MTRFSEHADTYLAAGFTPIPVKGKLPPVKGVTGTKRSVTAEDVRWWVYADHPSYGNLAIRHEQTVAVDVDEGYGDKDGVSQLAQLVTRHRLPPLPATHSTTARGDDSPSRQYLYRVPAGVVVTAETRLRSKPCAAVELCYRNHRYTVAYPSVHPDTGDVYRWYLPADAGAPPSWGARCEVPHVQALAELPAAWWSHLHVNTQLANPNAANIQTVSEHELLATFRPAVGVEASELRRIREHVETLDHVGHDDFFALGLRVLELGREGVPGAGDAYLHLKQLAHSYLTAQGRPDTELPSMVATIVDRAQRNLLWRTVRGIKPDGTIVYKRYSPK